MTSTLPETVRRWVRLQKELGVDEVFLDAPWAPPAPTPQAPAARSPRSADPAGPDPRRAPQAHRPAPAQPPSAPDARRPGFAAASQAAPPFDLRGPATPASAGQPPRQPLRAAPAAAAPVARPAAAPPQRAPAVPVFPDLSALDEHVRNCSRCILHGRRKALVHVGGAARSSWAILTLYGWADDAETGRLLSGGYAAPFLDLVKAAGLPEPVILPVLACAPADPADTTVQGFTEAMRCRPHWLQALKLHGARAALVLDHKATQLVRGPSAQVAWPAFRGETWSIDGIPAVSTHHPARLARSAALGPEVSSDLQRVKHILENPT